MARHSRCLLLVAPLLLALAGAGRSEERAATAEVSPPASERYAAAAVQEVPDFRRHLAPLLGRLGCNGRACHGSFQGQGGFRLSLFGYDFRADHEALAGRLDPTNPADSLVLLKPTRTLAHKGGKRLDAGSWQYHLLHRWIESGARGLGKSDSALLKLEVTPREVVFAKDGDHVALRILARWSDGSAEDVTPLCRYQTNDESIAEVDGDGVVTSKGRGDTHVVAFYDQGVAVAPVLRPVSGKVGADYPDQATPTTIDALVAPKLRKLGIGRRRSAPTPSSSAA